ncbi:protein LURP-one-related 7 isoform X1 [Gossypium australe]|uniref:Protein LURP-one-related 7 isoform X1 n=1 Tax=Gossypium australe TaxID=47621 RepID=A0A5B6UKA0_9ROSI|nr:protein LURP-one-related 7 isoform X1 [Gossypium australe]
MATTSAPVYPANTPIPFDLFVSKKHRALPRGVLGFADSSGNIVFKVNRQDSKSSFSHAKAILLDSAGNPLISLYPHNDGSWQGFKGDDGDKDLIFKVQRVLTKFTRTELEAAISKDLAPSTKVIPLWLSKLLYNNHGCFSHVQVGNGYTIHLTPYRNWKLNFEMTCSLSIRVHCLSGSSRAYLALLLRLYLNQTSLMHKLRKICVSRSKFRLTMFPSLEDPSLVVALVVIFLFSGPKKFQDYFSKIRMEREMAATMKVFDGGWSAISVGGWDWRNLALKARASATSADEANTGALTPSTISLLLFLVIAAIPLISDWFKNAASV